MTDAPDQIEAWANYNGDIDGHWVSTTPPEIATPTVLDPPSFSTSYTRTDLYDAVVVERGRMREALQIIADDFPHDAELIARAALKGGTE